MRGFWRGIWIGWGTGSRGRGKCRSTTMGCDSKAHSCRRHHSHCEQVLIWDSEPAVRAGARHRGPTIACPLPLHPLSTLHDEEIIRIRNSSSVCRRASAPSARNVSHGATRTLHNAKGPGTPSPCPPCLCDTKKCPRLTEATLTALSAATCGVLTRFAGSRPSGLGHACKLVEGVGRVNRGTQGIHTVRSVRRLAPRMR